MTVSELCTSNETLSGYYGSQIVCSDSSECDYNMRCIDGEDCTVTCSGPHSCRYGALHPPNVGNLTVTCGPNKYSCHGTTLRAPMNGSFTLSCGGWVSCNYVYAFCPIFGDCTVEIVSSHYDHIMTVNASSMISGGLYIVEIQRSTVLCPGNYLECIANCTAAPCKSTSFYTQRDSSLSIFASGASSLQNANVYCALYANCSIIITQPVSDVLLHFKLYSIDAMNQRLICDYAHNASECYDYKDPPQLWCGSQYDTGCAMVNTGNNSWGCENMTFSELCTNNETLRGYYGSHILCKDGGECNYDMRCIDGEDCTVTCSGAGSCGSGTIHGPNAGNLTVTCGGGEYACHAMTLRGQMNGSLALSCAGHNTCGSVYAMCPIYGDCTVEVTYFHHTNPLTVDATNMTYGGLHVIELQSGTVKCPGNYLECVADCIAVPCTGTSFHTKEDSILRIFASGASSLQNVEVYSALNTNYSIVVTDPVSDALSHFKLYSADAMKDVIDKRLICDYSHNISECYDDKDPPQLWCGSQYDTGCAMVNKGNNSWDCQNMTVSELCTSNETLSGYYGSQIVCSKQGECNSVDLYCIDGEYCAVTCSASGSCGGATIHPPNVGNLSVTCGPSEHSCRDLILKRPMNGSFTLSCAGHGSCFNVDAICPVFGDCTVEVTYFHHTNPVTVDATHMTYGKLQVIELQSGTVHCPGNYLECVADCIAVPCTGTSFDTKNGSILTILSSGISSLQSVNIYCALNANCSITVDCGAQRSVVCDIESNTGPSYNEWRCNVPDSSHSINFTDLCVTADPTTNPSADPIIKPTADPTDTKLNTGTETSITITCGGSDCHFDEETAKVITNILIAYLDEDVQIIGTTITSNKVIIAIANADWDSLERDTISRDIKNELEDVDVSFDDAEDDEEIEHIKPNSDIFRDILEFLTSNIILGIIIGLALFLIIMAVGCVCWLLKKRKRAKIHQNMMTIPGVNVTDADIVPGATTQAKMHHLNMMEMPGTTTQADTVTPPIVPPLPPPTTRDYDEESINDKDTDDEADELYDVVFEDTKGGNTKDGNTKGGNTKGAITAM